MIAPKSLDLIQKQACINRLPLCDDVLGVIKDYLYYNVSYKELMRRFNSELSVTLLNSFRFYDLHIDMMGETVRTHVSLGVSDNIQLQFVVCGACGNMTWSNTIAVLDTPPMRVICMCPLDHETVIVATHELGDDRFEFAEQEEEVEELDYDF